MSVTLKWNGPKFTRMAMRHLADNLTDATLHLETEVVKLLRTTKGSYRPPKHSDPGQSPFEITGEVADSFQHLIDRKGLYGAVFSDDPVSRYLEFGTRLMDARPYFEKTILAHWNILAAKIGRPM